jgi:phospholipase/carboxylesterase
MIETSLLTLGGAVASACGGFKTPTSDYKPLLYPNLLAKPTVPPAGASVRTGISAAYSSGGQEALLYVPTGYNPSVPAPMLVMLAGEGASTQAPVSNSQLALSMWQSYADANNAVIVGMQPYGATWDYLNGTDNYGPDVQFISYALSAIFQIVNVDPARLSIGGFSDGAMYAFAIALTNGTLFSKGLIFGAAYTLPCDPVGKPSFFVANGTDDQVAPPSGGGFLIDDFLSNHGYPVDYVVFNGGHEVPASLVAQAATWLSSS